MNTINIIGYIPEHQPYFEKFNRAWIEEWFTMEPLDEWVLTNPEEAIMKDGGEILMASYNGEIAGTVALRKLSAGSVEAKACLNLQKWRWVKVSGERALQKNSPMQVLKEQKN